jgi:hypothetical protein
VKSLVNKSKNFPGCQSKLGLPCFFEDNAVGSYRKVSHAFEGENVLLTNFLKPLKIFALLFLLKLNETWSLSALESLDM